MGGQRWINLELSSTAGLPEFPIFNPLADQVSQWLSRPKIVIPPESTHAVTNRMIMGAADQDTKSPPGERFLKTLSDALINRSATGSEMDGGESLAWLALVRNVNAPQGGQGAWCPR